MKHSILTLSFIVAFAARSTVHGESPYDRELQQLSEQRNKALASAAEPINRRYRAALEQLLRRATQANDLDAAVKIKQQMEAVGFAPDASLAPTANEVIGLWTFKGERGGGLNCEMKPDGTCTLNGKPGKWTLTSKHLKVDHLNGNWERFDMPVRDGKLVGVNQGDEKVTATKKTQ